MRIYLPIAEISLDVLVILGLVAAVGPLSGLLGIIGVLMVVESVRAWLRSRNPMAPRRKLYCHTWMHGLAF